MKLIFLLRCIIAEPGYIRWSPNAIVQLPGEASNFPLDTVLFTYNSLQTREVQLGLREYKLKRIG